MVTQLTTSRLRLLLSGLLCLAISSKASAFQPGVAKPVSDVELRERIVRAMRDGCAYLKARQKPNGSWTAGPGARWGDTPVGNTSVAILALINNDFPVDSEPIRRGLSYLRSLPPDQPGDRYAVYEASLMIMALCAVDDMRMDRDRITRLVRAMEATQSTDQHSSGMWGYKLVGRGIDRPGSNSEDNSNSQYAILALRDAAYVGIEIDQDIWKRAHEHWLNAQLPNGAWAYRNDQKEARGSMTAAGLSTLAITSRMLQEDNDVDPDGKPDCCVPHPPAEAFEKGRRWLGQNNVFSVNANPGNPNWHYYYLYGLERAGRLGNVRFFGKYDWYRAGARYLVTAQKGDGSWNDRSTPDPTLSTAFALLFLSKGLSRVVVNKLDYISEGDKEEVEGDWNRHPLDVPNLIEKVDGLEGWPPRLTSQVLALKRLNEDNAVSDMNQAPVLYISGKDALQLTDQHVKWIREYIDEGGFVFAVANCQGGSFDTGFRQLVERMFPDGDASLQRLQSDHPVYRSEYAFPNAEAVELYGVDFGCRTAIIYSPEDLGCLWQKWMKYDPPGRNPGLPPRIERATRIGINVLAYATGREPPVKLNEDRKSGKGRKSQIERGLTEIAQLRHSGGWDTAPKALGNLLEALSETVGMGVSPQRRTIPITLDELRRFPLVYMHGRYGFRLSQQERDALRDYLSRGPVLIADACCGAPRFDRSFRDLMSQIFPEHPLQPIPVDHELYSDAIGHQIDQVKLRKLVPAGVGESLESRTETTPPILEGIEIDGRYVVIYSRYDISCALENQASLACDGYVEKDAMRLAVNIVLYAMLQDVSWKAVLEGSPSPTP
ncbi:DUF4159 domain-containing protein [Fuerstiella marisgermanici]|uniref:Squalene/oxidosqualene cyclase n=1 Tax=Fuerstiella marisgermanici TaxID=1891926 RepID=A0A1P8WJA6_9PLAN|nr:DUF4159 domain-containing protein [Fuerstiella marisgermanici]APZ94144.1 squalene/oxidosqualene cyclase [Fuerstiella marisgermanici]